MSNNYHKNQKRYNENSSYAGNQQHYQQQQTQASSYHNHGSQKSLQSQVYDPFGQHQKQNGPYGGPDQKQRPQTAYGSKDQYQKGNYKQGGYPSHHQSQMQMPPPQQKQWYNDDDRDFQSKGPAQNQYNRPQQRPPQQKQIQDPEQRQDYRPFDQAPQKPPPQQKQQFASRPQTSTVAKFNTTAQTQSQGAAVSVVSNQYKLKLGSSVQVYQYALQIIGMEMWDSNLVQKIIRFKRTALEKALGLYAVSGACIYILSELDEDVKFDCMMQGTKYVIYIDKSTLSLVTLEDKFDNQDNTVTQTLINIIIKQAFRDTNLKQIGKTPRFFDIQNAINLEKQNMRIMSGFKASAFQSQVGCTLVVDSIFKFMSTYSCLNMMMDLMRGCDRSKGEYRCKLEFVDKSIIANWGNQRQYIVCDIIFDSNPMRMNFEHNGEKISISDYFLQTYKLKLQHPNQPLFLVKVAQREFYLPPELCLIDGVPAEMRKGAGMRDALAHTRITPGEKMNRIKGMVKDLFSQKAVKDWNIEVEEVPIQMNTSIMAAPQMLTNNQIIRCDENALRKNAITKPANLYKDEWIMVYENTDRVFKVADNIYNDLQKASGQLKLVVQEPYWIELDKENDWTQLDREMQRYMFSGKILKHPKMVLFVVQRENNYEQFKEIMLKYSIASQVVTFRNGSKFNLSKATNILRQINSKAGGDLYHLKFPTVMDKKRTMLIGIDVCHAGPKSIVGFSASINPEMSQYYSEHFVQQKGQEIVKDHMKDAIMSAIQTFAGHHKNEFPTNFVIYRDGVGDAQQLTVLSKEIPQLEAAIQAMYNKASFTPEITVVVVNKRISQRFFVKDAQGRLSNPPPGCIIDKDLVQDHGDKSEKFDFFLTPALTTQGCVLPTHFYVPKNDSALSRIDIEQLTYTLCYYYYNWTGSIKVPAPCQYAHKIAEFFTNINAHRKKDQKGAQNSKEIQQIKQQVVPLQAKLHFL